MINDSDINIMVEKKEPKTHRLESPPMTVSEE